MGSLAKAIERKAEHTQISSPGALQEVRYTTDSGIDLAFTADDIRAQICETATNKEIAQFMMMCKAQKLNPFMGDAYLIKYGNGPATMVTASKVMLRRAEQNPHYRGYESGVVVKDGTGTIDHRPGGAVYDGETLMGGWCKVYRDDRSVPVYVEVSMKEYRGNEKSLWGSKPAVMITKVAESTAHRKAFSDLSGMYAAEEFEAEEAAPVPATTNETQPQNRLAMPTQESEPTYEVEEDAPVNGEEIDRLRDMMESLVSYAYDEESVRKTLWATYNEGGIQAAEQYYMLAVRQAEAGGAQ